MFTLVCALFMRTTKNAIDERKDANELTAADELSTVGDQANNEKELSEQTDDTRDGTRRDTNKDKTGYSHVDDNANKKDENGLAAAVYEEGLSEQTDDTVGGTRRDTNKDESDDFPVDDDANKKVNEGATVDVHCPTENENPTIETTPQTRDSLFIFESWNEKVSHMIKHFCKNRNIDSKWKCYSTTLDSDIREDVEQNALAVGVTLISPRRTKKSDPKLDPPSLSWLYYHEIYYPHLKDIRGSVKYVIGCRQATEKQAEEIKVCLFPDAELHYVDESCLLTPSAALFIYTEWDKNHLGLSQCHRTLIQDFCARKAKVNKILKVYATVRDVSDDQKKDAERFGVILIPAERKSHDVEDPSDVYFLSHHETYYPHLRDLEHIEYVVGYAPKTADEAIDIKNTFFPTAKLILINHENPEDQYQMTFNPNPEAKQHMLDVAKSADAVVSFGPSIYQHYQNEYRAAENLREVHVELVPKPRPLFAIKNVKHPEEPVDTHLIFSYGKLVWKNLDQYKKLAAEINECGKMQGEFGKGPPKWRIYGFLSESDREKAIAEIAEAFVHLEVALYPFRSMTAKTMLEELQQAHLYLPTPFGEEIPNLEALAIGLPLLSQGNSQLSKLLKTYFTEEGGHCLVKLDEKLRDKIRKVLSDQGVSLAFKQAERLKKKYEESYNVTKSYAIFAALFKPGISPQDIIAKDISPICLKVPVELEKLPLKLEAFEEWCRECIEKQAAECTHRDVAAVCHQVLGEDVKVIDVRQGSLAISLGFPSLFTLYRFEARCESGHFAKAFDPLLITDEMRTKATKVGIKLKLKASYNRDKFEEVELFFLRRDGGGVEPMAISEDLEDLSFMEAQQPRHQAMDDRDEEELFSDTPLAETGKQYDQHFSIDARDQDNGMESLQTTNVFDGGPGDKKEEELHQNDNPSTQKHFDNADDVNVDMEETPLPSKVDSGLVLTPPSTAATSEETTRSGDVDTSRTQVMVTIAHREKTDLTTVKDEDEVLYSQHARLDRFDHTIKEWIEHGSVNLKFVKEKISGHIRLSIRGGQSSPDFADCYLNTEMELWPKAGSEGSWVLNVKNFTEVGSNPERQIALVFKTTEEAKEFNKKFEQCQAMLTRTNRKAERLELTTIEDTLKAIGALFKDKRSVKMWRCDSCFVSNKYFTVRCGGCDAVRPELLHLDKGSTQIQQ